MNLSLPWVLGVTAIAVVAGLGVALSRGKRPMKTLFGRLVGPSLDAFDDRYGYDTTYLRHIADTSSRAFLRFGLFTRFAEHRAVVSSEAWFTAKLCAALREDCGPCTQLVVKLAEEAGVSPDVIRPIIAKDPKPLPTDARIAFDLAQATLDRDLVGADAARAEALARWGDEGVIALAFAIASSRVYPTVKYALGYGRTCSRVVVGEEEMAPGAHAHV